MSSSKEAFNLDFERIKHIHPSTKLIVEGYLRESQLLLPSDNPYYIIPELIHFICLCFYDIFEYFNSITKTKIVCFGPIKQSVNHTIIH